MTQPTRHMTVFMFSNCFFANNNNTNKNGIAALKQQNWDGDTPLHKALDISDINDKKSADVAKLMLKYECNVATIYNKKGYLPIHVACSRDNWEALAVLIQKGYMVNIQMILI